MLPPILLVSTQETAVVQQVAAQCGQQLLFIANYKKYKIFFPRIWRNFHIRC